jgi:hypothetical protein
MPVIANLIEVRGPEELREAIEKAFPENKAQSFQAQKKSGRWFEFFPSSSKRAVVSDLSSQNNETVILYKNGGLESLIVANNKEYYFCDLVRGAAPTDDVREILGEKYHDIFQKMRSDLQSESIRSTLDKWKGSNAIKNAYDQIKEMQLGQAQNEQVKSPRKLGHSAGAGG